MRFIVFDCDGTLVNSHTSIYKSIDILCNRLSLPSVSVATIMNYIGLPTQDFMTSLFPDVASCDIEKITHAYLDIKGQYSNSDDISLYDGVVDVLAQLHDSDTLMGIVTGHDKRTLLKILDHHDIKKYFAVLKTANCGPSKPNPTSLLHAIETVGADKHNTVMIGDTSFDMDVAKNAGVFSIGITHGFHDCATLQSHGSDYIVDTFYDIPKAVEKVLSKG